MRIVVRAWMVPAIFTVVSSIVTYTATVTWMYADVRSELRNINTVVTEKQQANDRDHLRFEANISELWRLYAGRQASTPIAPAVSHER